MKVAVLLCSHVRTWERCRQSFLNFIKGVDCDIFVHTYDVAKDYHPYVEQTFHIQNNQEKKPVDLKIETVKLVVEGSDDWVEEIKEVQKDVPWHYRPEKPKFSEFQILRGKGILIRNYLQYRKFRLCNELRKEHERETGLKYDFVFKTRLDVDYSTVVPLYRLLSLVKEGIILTSSSNVQPNDHMYLGTPKDVDRLLIGMKEVVFPPDREYNAHEFLAGSLRQAGLKWSAQIHRTELIRE